jgi:hypothetical protein
MIWHQDESSHLPIVSVAPTRKQYVHCVSAREDWLPFGGTNGDEDDRRAVPQGYKAGMSRTAAIRKHGRNSILEGEPPGVEKGVVGGGSPGGSPSKNWPVVDLSGMLTAR